MTTPSNNSASTTHASPETYPRNGKTPHQGEERYKAVLRAAMDGFWMADTQGRLLDVNVAYCRMSGYSEQELLSMSIADVEALESSEEVAGHIRKIMNIGELRFETRHRRKDGSIFDVEVSSQYRAAEGGRIVSFLRDITERKQAREALRESEQMLRHLTDHLPNAMVYQLIIEPDGSRRFTFVNRAVERLNEVTVEHVLADAGVIYRQLLPEYVELVRQREEQALKSLATFRVEVQSRLPSGRLRWFSLTSTPRYQPDGRLVWDGLEVDITDRKLAEEELQKLASVVRYTGELINLATLDGKMTFVNEAGAKILGINKDDVDRTTIMEVIPDHLKAEVENNILPALMARGTWKGELQALNLKTGQVTDLYSTAFTVNDPGTGAPLYLAHVAMDITELKQAEAAIKKSEERFAKAFKASPASMTIASLEDGRYIEVNDLFLKKTGFQRDEVIGRTSTELNVWVDLNDRQRFVEELSKKGVLRDFAVQYRLRSGEIGDFLVSSERIELEGKPCSLNFIVDVTERKRAEQALRESEERFRTIFEEAHQGIVINAPSFAFEKVNPAFCRMLGYTADEMLSMTFADITYPDHIKQDIEKVKKVGRGELPFYKTEKRYVHKNGSIIWAEVIVSSIRDTRSKALRYYLTMINDITERKQAEQEKAELQAQLQQAQKLESVGRLAGGVAHDFNNMLSVILGYADMAMTKVNPSEPLHEYMEEIIMAANRSAKVTRQLLAFARKQTVAPKILDLNATVASMHKMLERIIGEQIRLEWQPGRSLWSVKVDPSQIDQILANLCVNARDAIIGSGKITISTENAILDAEYCKAHPGCVPGEYVRLVVCDNGKGMDQETLSHIFEPFFTTKGVGEGTGLGLAMVYGAVQQNNGFINAESLPDRGTTFTIYLPMHTDESCLPAAEETPGISENGWETILLVEDEPTVLTLTTKMLERQGYRILPASTPDQAIDLIMNQTFKIHLLITDVIMPEMNGRDLWRRLCVFRPNLKCLYMSGYPDNTIAKEGILESDAHFIQKPFAVKELAAKVRSILNS